MFYVGGYSHAEIALFLGVNAATVNNRFLRTARRKIRERTFAMAREELQQVAPSRDQTFVAAVHFCNAAEAGNLAQLREMIKIDPAVVNAVHPQRKNKALHLAAERDHVDVVRLLLEAGADPLEDFHPFGYRHCPLALARSAGHYEVVELIEQHLRAKFETGSKRLDEPDDSGNRVLHRVVYHRHHALVTDLLKRGANPEVRNNWGQKPIHLALAPLRGMPDGVTAGLLLEYGADVNVTNTNNPHEEGWVENGAPLIAALKGRHLEVAELLLESGAMADVVFYAGPTALDLAETQGYQALATRLIGQGARHVYGSYVARGDYLLIGELLDRCSDEMVGKGNKWSVAGYFLLCGVRHRDETIVIMCLKVNPRLASREVQRVLCNVMHHDRNPGDQEIQGRNLIQCLEHGLDANAADEDGIGLLHGLSFAYWISHLSDEGCAFYASILLDHGAELDAPDRRDGLRPLTWAARYGRRLLVELFLSRGAMVEVRGEKAEATPLTWARQSGFDEITGLLEEAVRK